MLQNSWLKNNGYIKKRNQGISRKNPSIGLTEAQHKRVTELQREAGMFDESCHLNVTWEQNMIDNINILKQANVPISRISKLIRETAKFARKYL